MDRKWEYCTMVVTHTIAIRMLAVTILRLNGSPQGHNLGTNQLGSAIAQLGCEGWEMCGFYTINLSDGLGQQFYFKRRLV
jgi:broad specificity phosphatase PhoE